MPKWMPGRHQTNGKELRGLDSHRVRGTVNSGKSIKEPKKAMNYNETIGFCF